MERVSVTRERKKEKNEIGIVEKKRRKQCAENSFSFYSTLTRLKDLGENFKTVISCWTYFNNIIYYCAVFYFGFDSAECIYERQSFNSFVKPYSTRMYT